MASHNFRDRVAIVGMGCTPFGEQWGKGADDLLVEAADEALESAGICKEDVDAYWLGTLGAGLSGLTLAGPLKVDYKPVTRVENFCATGSDALRNACMAVAAGVYDRVMAIGVEKLKDTGLAGINLPQTPDARTDNAASVPALFSLLATSYCHTYGLTEGEMREVLTHIAWKNHANGARNPRAQFRREVSKAAIDASRKVTDMLGVLDCSGVADGAAAAIVVPAADAHRYTDEPLYVKALALAAGPATGAVDEGYDFTTFPEVTRSAADAYAQAGVATPREELALVEVHDCFTPTELILIEDLGLADRGTAGKHLLAGTFDLDGELPVNPDGGLMSFGHPIGATGLRMTYECWLQLRGEAGPERQIHTTRKLGLVNNIGGQPGACVSLVAIVGTELG
jgi:acetyl-CoA C-acetyltransferase